MALTVAVGFACAIGTSATPAAASVTAHVDYANHRLVVEGSDANDYFDVDGYADGETYQIQSFDTLVAGDGCWWAYTATVKCVRRPDGDGKFSVHVSGGGGNDEVTRAYAGGLGHVYDPAVLEGGPGDDMVGGSPGTDVIAGGPGDDLVDGQRGDDYVTGGLLESPEGQDAGADHVYGGWGDDLVVDGDDDSATEGLGADRLDGGSCEPDVETYGRRCRDEGTHPADFDVVDWSERTHAVKIDLGQTGAAQGKLDATGAVVENETILHVDGALSGSGKDQLLGDDAANVLDAGGGTDRVEGGGGADALDGGESADDQVYGGDGDDLLMGGSTRDDDAETGDGSDEIIGGDGVDELSYEGRANGVTIDLRASGAVQGEAGEGDIAGQIESASGGVGDDVLIGAPGTNVLTGMGGGDTIHTRGDFGRADVVDCGAGTDSLTRDLDDTTTACERINSGPTTPTPPDMHERPNISGGCVQPGGAAPCSADRGVDAPRIVGASTSLSISPSSRGLFTLRQRVECRGRGPDCSVTTRAVLGTGRRALELGRSSFKVRTGATGRISVRLSARGKRRLRRRKRIRVRVTVTVARGHTRALKTFRVTVKQRSQAPPR